MTLFHPHNYFDLHDDATVLSGVQREGSSQWRRGVFLFRLRQQLVFPSGLLAFDWSQKS